MEQARPASAGPGADKPLRSTLHLSVGASGAHTGRHAEGPRSHRLCGGDDAAEIGM